MRRYVWFVALSILVACNLSYGDTVRQLLARMGPEGAYSMSVIPELLRSNANVFFVDNEHTNALDSADGRHGKEWNQPFATFDFAIGQCTAGQNNIIVLLPYSVEEYDSAGDCDVDVSGITVLGIGQGPARPKFLFTDAAATFVVGRTGDGAAFYNITFQPSVTGVTVGVQHEDGADNISWVDCEWLDGEATGDEFVTAYDVVAEANDLSFIRCRWTSMTAGATAGIDIGDGAVAGLWLKDCVAMGDWSTAFLFSDQALTKVDIDGLAGYNANADEYILELQGTSNQGFCRNSVFVTSGNYVDVGGISLVGNAYKAIGDSDDDGVQYSIADGGITAAKIANDAIGATEIANGAIDAATFAAGAIAAAGIATDAIGAAELAADAVTEIATGVDPNKILNDSPRILRVAVADMSSGWGTADSPVPLFTVTGDVLCRMFAIVTTNCTSTSNTGTLEVGVAGDTACLLVQDVVDATAFQQNDCWTLDQAADTPSAEMDTNWVLIPNGLDIAATIGTNNMTAGAIKYYLQWIPLSADAAVVAAE